MANYYTFSAAAEMLGVSRQTVYNRVKQLSSNCKADCQPLTESVKGKKLLTEYGYSQIEQAIRQGKTAESVKQECKADCQSFTESVKQSVKQTVKQTAAESQPDGSESMQLALEILREQLAAKDEEIRRLHNQIDKLMQITDQAQKLNAAAILPPSDEEPLPDENTEPVSDASNAPDLKPESAPSKPQKGLFARLFGRDR